MTDAVIVAATRTPLGIGKPGKGALEEIHPVDLSALVLNGLVANAGIDPNDVDDVIWGCVTQVGEESTNIARNAVLAAGWDEDITGVTIDRQCGSSQQALHFAAASVIAGHSDVVVAGGVEMMSRIPMFSNMEGGDGPYGPTMKARYENRLVHQGISAEMIAKQWGLSREYLDELAVTSHARAAAARDAGVFTREILPVATSAGVVDSDQGIRENTTVESLAALKLPFDPEGVVTAGNASQISDGAAALLVMSDAKASALGAKPIARVHSVALAGVDPVIMLTAPIPATAKVLEKSGLSIDDIGVFEVNEAFASVLGAWLAETGADASKVNPRGGAIALGHPLGASGARLMTTMLHHMQDSGIRFGLQTMCEGGGMANATIVEML